MLSANILSNMTMKREELASFLSREGVAAIILFLYDQSHKLFSEMLTQAFHVINRHSGNEIDFWTYYDEERISDPTNIRYEDAYLMQMETRDRFVLKRGKTHKDSTPYDNMRLLGQLFEVDVSVEPWFIILNPEKGIFIKCRYEEVFRTPVKQLENIIETIEEKNFNWNSISEFYENPYDVLNNESIEQKLRDYIRISTNGFEINSLIRDGYNEDFLVRYVKNKYPHRTTYRDNSCYISLEEFLLNIKSLCKDNQEKQDRIKDIVDSYLPLLGAPGISIDVAKKKAFEPSSYSYLCYARKIAREPYCNGDSKFSLTCYCYGRALEEEINLGLVQKIRNSLGITMPNYYARYADFQIAKLECYCDNNRFDINYNERNGKGNSLRYPDISKTRQLLFENAQILTDYSNKQNELCSFIQDVKIKFNKNESYLIKNICHIRNIAVHGEDLLEESDCKKTEELFNELMDYNFFYKNNQIKRQLRNITR